MSDPAEPDGARGGQDKGGGRAPAGPVGAFVQMVIGGMVGAMLLLVGGLVFLFDAAAPLGGEQPATAVLGATETAPTAPPVTVTTQDPAAAWYAALAERDATTTTTAPPTTTTRPATTTTTTPPPPIAKGSATTTAGGATLDLDVIPSAAGLSRAIDARLLARFDDLRVLRAVEVGFGDGTALPGEVHPWACNAADAPNPYDLSLPGHTYARPGTYVLRATVITATCSPDDDDWGPEASSQVELTVVVN